MSADAFELREIEVKAAGMELDYSEWKAGNQKMLKRWPPVSNLET